MFKTRSIEKQSEGITYTGAWTGLAGVVENQAVSPGTNQAGYGTFATEQTQLSKDTGDYLIEGVDYNYDVDLDSDGADIYDTSNLGAFASGKYMRLIHDGVNVIDAGGLNLNIVAKDLRLPKFPLSTECYIDPKNGLFEVPRPIFWHRMESTSIDDAEIIGNNDSLSSSLGLSVDSNFSKFGDGWHWNLGATALRNLYIKPGESFNSFTLSAWIKLYIASGSYPSIDIILEDTVGSSIKLSYLGPTPSHKIIVNGIDRDTSSLSLATTTHLYIVVDKNGGLSGSDTIKVYLNGSLVMNTDITFTPGDLKIQFTNGSSATIYTNVYIDNLKIWNHVVSETPDWLYNSGTGRENALHEIYGASNNYEPNLQVGFYYTQDSGSPAKLTEADVGGQLEWEL